MKTLAVEVILFQLLEIQNLSISRVVARPRTCGTQPSAGYLRQRKEPSGDILASSAPVLLHSMRHLPHFSYLCMHIITGYIPNNLRRGQKSMKEEVDIAY